jgi:hypothetical protein
MHEGEDDRLLVQNLFKAIKENKKEIIELEERCNNEWGGEDGIYRFYHFSFKVYRLQELTLSIVKFFRKIHPVPDTTLNSMFEEIIKQGTGAKFELSHNRDWTKHTRPIVEAYFHAKWILDMMLKYGLELEYPPQLLPTGWATVLYLYDLR